MIATARYVESAVRGDPKLGILQLSNVAKTKFGEKHQLFTLWGPEFENSVSPKKILKDSRETPAEPQMDLDSQLSPCLKQGTAPRGHHQPSIVAPLDHENLGPRMAHALSEAQMNPNLLTSTELEVDSDAAVRRRLQSGSGTYDFVQATIQLKPSVERNSVGNRGAECNPGNISGANAGILQRQKHSDHILCDRQAPCCLSLLLDFTGLSYHISTGYKSRDPQSIKSKKLSSIVQKIFEKKKSSLSQMGQSVTGLKYSSLLPKNMEGRTVIFTSIKLSRDRNGSPFTVIGWKDVAMSVQKPSRNSKGVCFALVARFIRKKPPEALSV